MRFILTILFVSINFCLLAQESKKYLKYKSKINWTEGYVKLNDSSMVEGLIREYTLNEVKRYSTVSFINKQGEKTVYYPVDLLEYRIRFSKKFFSNNHYFFERVSKGERVSLYKKKSANSWSVPGAPGMGSTTYSNSQEELFIKKVGEPEYKYVRKKNFDNEFSAYFSDCNTLKNKIQHEELTHKDIKKILNEYNYRCK
jgi:hypothetical protein